MSESNTPLQRVFMIPFIVTVIITDDWDGGAKKYNMSRPVPSFRIVLAEEKKEWKPFRNALDKKEQKEFDEMWDVPKLYVSACSNSVSIRDFSIPASILLNNYKQLTYALQKSKRDRSK
jgi:hypothetical protein